MWFRPGLLISFAEFNRLSAFERHAWMSGTIASRSAMKQLCDFSRLGGTGSNLRKSCQVLLLAFQVVKYSPGAPDSWLVVLPDMYVQCSSVRRASSLDTD